MIKYGKNGIIGVRTLEAGAPEDDPEQVIDMNGIADPFTAQFFLSVVNGFASTIYVDAYLVSPHADWTDSAQQFGAWTAGQSQYKVKNNATRDKPAAGTNETLTLRVRAYSDAGYSSQIDQVDIILTVYYEDFSTGTQDEITNFDDGLLNSWVFEQEAGGGGYAIVWSEVYRSSPYCLQLRPATGINSVGIVKKTITVGAGDRAAIVVHARQHLTTTLQTVIEIETPVATTSFLVMIPEVATWIRIGMRLTPGADNIVKLRGKTRSGAAQWIYFDDIEVRHW